MTKNNQTNIKNALKYDKDFMEFIEQQAGSEEFQRIKKDAEQGPHPDGEMLYDYVLGWLDTKDSLSVREHITYCGICAGQMLQIRIFEHDFENADAQGKKNLPEIVKKKHSENFI